MRRSRRFRLIAALFGVWFTFTLVQPNGMMGMTMSGMDASVNMPPSMSMAGMDMSDMSADQMAMHSEAPVKSKAPVECYQHDCCCSALSLISLMPVATFSWLPEHVVNQHPPRSGDNVVHADGQVLLPFANGPPRTVTA